MKNDGFSVIATLLFLLIFGGFGAFIQGIEAIVQGVGLGIFSILKVFNHLPTSIFDLVAMQVTSNWQFTYVVWIDTLLVNIAIFIPSLLFFVISLFGLRELHPAISGTISIVILIGVLELFSSVIFWIIVVIIIFILIVRAFYIKISLNKQQQITIEEAKDHPIEEVELDEEKEKIIAETNKYDSLYDLWKKNIYRPFKAHNTVNNTYVYIKENPEKQYKKYGHVYGILAYNIDTYNHGFNCAIYYASKPIWEFV